MIYVITALGAIIFFMYRRLIALMGLAENQKTKELLFDKDKEIYLNNDKIKTLRDNITKETEKLNQKKDDITNEDIADFFNSGDDSK